MIRILALVSMVAVAHSQTFGFFGCPAVTIQTPIDLIKIVGKWYEYARSQNAPEYSGICQTSIVSINLTTMTVNNKQYDIALNGAEKISTGTGTVNLSLAKATINYSGTAVNYNILKTDYDNYMAIEACSDYWLFHYKTIWVLTKARIPTQTYVDAAYAEFTKQKFDIASLEKTDQLLSCPIFH